jgi:DNA mismatch endonuclease (patch repair protein)
VPKTKTEWWINKIARNKQLDTEYTKILLSGKWNVITIFECELKKGSINSTLKNLVKRLSKMQAR